MSNLRFLLIHLNSSFWITGHVHCLLFRRRLFPKNEYWRIVFLWQLEPASFKVCLMFWWFSWWNPLFHWLLHALQLQHRSSGWAVWGCWVFAKSFQKTLGKTGNFGKTKCPLSGSTLTSGRNSKPSSLAKMPAFELITSIAWEPCHEPDLATVWKQKAAWVLRQYPWLRIFRKKKWRHLSFFP